MTLRRLSLTIALIAGCDGHEVSVSVTSARIDTVALARAVEGERAIEPSSTFAPEDRDLHALVAVSHVPPDTKFIGAWFAVDAGGVKDLMIDRSEYLAAGGTTSVHFTLSNDGPWPPGAYRFDVQIAGESPRTTAFTVR
ncbi:MAG: hypothetical protein U0168_04175 [Nannocystaceae bacterium]|jgi:hypothetical protein